MVNGGVLGAGCWGAASRRRLLLAVSCAGPAACASPAAIPPSTQHAARSSWVDSTLATLTLRDKAAQMVWPWILADYVSGNSGAWQATLRLVNDQHVGGFIVSVGSPIEMASKINDLQRASRTPLLVGADFEGGAGFRARGGYFVPNGIDLGGATLFPQQMAIGASRDASVARDLGRITALEGRALGVHVAFAPVLDVNNNPGNPVIGPRSFGEDPQLVARMGVAFIEGMQANGMVATAKHFPGHGDTEVNSHLDLPSIKVSRARLDSVELVPFRAAVKAGVGAVMTFHGALPALDSSGVPATVSPAVMTGLLRKELGFGGLLVTDALDMRGVLAQMGLAEAVKRAVIAGSDVLLMPPDIAGAIDAVVAGVREGRITEARLDSSVRKLLVLKREMGLDRNRLVSVERLRDVVGDTANVAAARRAAERGITLVKDSLRSVPLDWLTSGGKVLSLTIAPRNDLAAGREFDAELRRRFGDRLRSVFIDANDPLVDYGRYVRLADSAEAIVVGAYSASGWDVATTSGAAGGVAELVRGLAKGNARTVLVSFASPYMLRQVPEVPAYLVAWGGFAVSQRAAARALTGQAPITGKLPITIPPVAAFGAGIERLVAGRR
jgi:beta-N-acetylhexosaminidase